MTDHDLLIQLNDKVDMIGLLLTNHLHHHFIYTVTLFGAFFSTMTAFVLYWLKNRQAKE
jgi:hypothetical protein